MVVRFHIVAPVAKQQTFSVRLPVLLGRGEEATFRVQHDLVSRRHCELFESAGRVCLRDLGSTNGTFLNDEQVPAAAEMAVPPGGIVRVGGLSFTVDYQAAAPRVAAMEAVPAEPATPAASPAAVEEAAASTAAAPPSAAPPLDLSTLDPQPDAAVDAWSMPDPGPTEPPTDDDQLNAFFKGLE